MRTRSVLYGYRYENGAIEYDQTEREIFLRMTDMYIDGMSLSDIAKAFNEQQIEYAPGVIGWNKSRIMRILSDERYTGVGKYPAMISVDIHKRILDRRDRNSCLTNTDFSAEIYRLTVPIMCPDCGGIMKRKNKGGKKGKKSLNCASCGYTVFIDDEDLLGGIKGQLIRYVNDPYLINIEESPDLTESKEITDLNSEIEWSLERPAVKTDTVLDNIRRLAALRYTAIDDQYYISQKLIWEFIQSGRLREEHPERWKDSLIDLANRTVGRIHIGRDGKISIELRNGQQSMEGA